MEVVEEGVEPTEEEEGEEEDIFSGSGVEDLEERLAEIYVNVPAMQIETDDPLMKISEFPLSYRENSHKEKLLLAFAENFRKQYAHLYRDRKVLFLTPLNECSVEKFVSTTIHPSLLSHSELYSWDACSQFVSDFLTMQPLDPPINPPQYLFSPITVLKQQQGNCFDYSVLLCSLLIGAGYDAYCVSGYAIKEICLMDESREICPLLMAKEEKETEEKKVTTKKYAVKPPRDLQSKFEQQQEAKRLAEMKAAEEKKQLEEEKRIAELEKPEHDPLYGLRVHCWVLVLAGKREVAEHFFIDPFTGQSYRTTDEMFLGIESIWNHENYWINMQDCRNGCKDLTFDLGDPVKWEFMLLSTGKPLLTIPDMEEEELQEEADDELEEKEEEMIFEMPPSWVPKLDMTLKDFETRYPQGKKIIQYKKAKLEKFAPYLMEDGLVTKLITYEDSQCIHVTKVEEWFKNRQDKLVLREHKKKTGLIAEYFAPGRSHALRVHTYKTMMPETERTMTFYSEARVDGLLKRDETVTEMTETYRGRLDFLHYRHVVFGKRPKKVRMFEAGETVHRPIMKITECFHRNREKLASEDVAERVFLISDERIQVTYHREDDQITASKWQFTKPSNQDDKDNQDIILTPDMIDTFQADPWQKPQKNLYVYNMFLSLLEAEEQSKQQVRKSEAEVREILNCRAEEEAAVDLIISVYDTERNEKGKKHRQELERLQMEERLQRMEQELDYLAPFLIQIGNPEKLTKMQAIQLKEDCLSDLKQRLIDRANLIQSRFEKETHELQKKQQWYQQNQVTMSKEDEESYLTYCSDAMFRIHILEMRLNR
ncbi:dynein regulatory complex subunit 7 isoform X2 [Protopterus annectens]|nr:dynein regulatory complex subunit 7 isoform X2 [Protopterus annectens]